MDLLLEAAALLSRRDRSRSEPANPFIPRQECCSKAAELLATPPAPPTPGHPSPLGFHKDEALLHPGAGPTPPTPPLPQRTSGIAPGKAIFKTGKTDEERRRAKNLSKKLWKLRQPAERQVQMRDKDNRRRKAAHARKRAEKRAAMALLSLKNGETANGETSRLAV
jgi:hypothetical protein